MENLSYESISQTYLGGQAVTIRQPHMAQGRNFPFSVFVQVDEGAYFVELDGVWHEIPAGHAVFVPSRVTHGIKMEQDGMVNWAHAHFTILGSLDVFSLYHTPLILDKQAAATIRESCYQLAKLHEQEYMEHMNAVTRLVHIQYYLTALMHIIIQNSTPNTNEIAQLKKMEIVYPSLTYISLNISKRLTIEELAEVSNLSVSRFYSVFKEATRLSPMDYVIREKLKRACQLLLFESKPINEIAWELGYEDPLYFSKIFKRKFGISPSEYKKQYIPHNP